MMQIKVKITNIDWDIDDDENDERISLPTQIVSTFECDDECELDDTISDWLSDEYGYCHNGFDYKILA